MYSRGCSKTAAFGAASIELEEKILKRGTYFTKGELK
jgi:hypothetical protein